MHERATGLSLRRARSASVCSGERMRLRRRAKGACRWWMRSVRARAKTARSDYPVDERRRWMIDAQIADRAVGVEGTGWRIQRQKVWGRYWALYEALERNKSAARRTTNLVDVEPAIHMSPSRRQNAAIRTPQAVSLAQSSFPATCPAARAPSPQPPRIGTLPQRHRPRSPC